MKIISNIIKYIVLIALIISMILTIAINIVTSTILNKEYILGKLEETNYYNNVYNQVESNFENYIYQSGLDEDVIKGIISENDIKEDTIQIIDNIYEKNNTEIDVNKIKERLETNIYNSLSKEKISDNTKKAIDQFIEKIVNEYKNTIVHTKYESNINNVLSKVINYSSKIKMILIAIDIILAIILLLLNLKNILKGVKQIGISLCATSIFYIIGNIIINTNIKIDTITVFNSAFSMSLRKILNDFLGTFILNAIILLVIGFILIFIANIILCKKIDDKN